MENEEQIKFQKKERNFRRATIIFPIVMLLGLGGLIYLQAVQNRELSEELRESRNENKNAATADVRKQATIDSSARILKNLETYRIFSEVVSFRDSILRNVGHEPGTIAYLKPDSLKVVVISRVVGGGKYDYYIRCVVRDSAGVFEVTPESLY